MMEKYKISVGNSSSMGEVINKRVGWEWLSNRLCQFETSKSKKSSFFVGGHFEGGVRDDQYMISRSLLTLDLDTFDGDIEALENKLEHINCAYVAYSTFNHTSERPRVRVVVPLSREVSKEEHGQVSRAFCSSISGLVFDNCSFKFNQFMYLPVAKDGGEKWSKKGTGDALDVEKYVDLIEDDEDDLGAFLAAQPLDMTSSDVDKWLSCVDAETCDYHQWTTIGMALHHQYQGGDIGLGRWVKWSRDDGRFKDGECEKKWSGFKIKDKPVTMASVVHIAKETGGVKDAFETLLDSAGEVSTLDGYQDFKQEFIDTAIGLDDDQVAMIAHSLVKNWGKDHGFTKSAIKSTLKKSIKKEDGGGVISWAQDWCYLEVPGVFYNTKLDYQVSTSSFNMKYSGETACVMSECSAGYFVTAKASNKIPFYVDQMYWPGAASTFSFEGKGMINSYKEQGIGKDGGDINQNTVDRFLTHVNHTLTDKKEQEILLDWLCHVINNPGERVNWALLLQGAQGTGKTYFVNLLQAALGTNVANLDPDSIAGRFTGWAEGNLVIAIEEIRIAGSNKYQILDKIKPFLTNNTIAIEQKGRDHKTVPNFTSYFLLSNHKDALPLIDGDRRYCVLFSKWQSESQMYGDLGGCEGAKDYFDVLFQDLEDDAQSIVRWLVERGVSSGFNHRGRAPDTSAKKSMMDYSKNEDHEDFEDILDKVQCEVINKNVIDVTHLNKVCEEEMIAIPGTKALMHCLLAMGYEKPTGGGRVKVLGKSHRVWVKCGFDGDWKTIVKDFHLGDDELPF